MGLRYIFGVNIVKKKWGAWKISKSKRIMETIKHAFFILMHVVIVCKSNTFIDKLIKMN